MKTHLRNKFFYITYFIVFFANSMAGQRAYLNDYLLDYSRSTKIFEVESNNFMQVLNHANDSTQYYLKCDMPNLFIASNTSSYDEVIIDFDALNLWSDSTYINQIRTSEKYSFIKCGKFLALCDSKVIDLLYDAGFLREADEIEPIDINKECLGLIGTGIFFGISIHSGQASLKYLQVLRSR